jgi:hypothetical protein
VNVCYGLGKSQRERGDKVVYYTWNSTDAADVDAVEATAISIDQLMRFRMDDMTGFGIFELLVQGDRYPRYPTWGVRGDRG